MVRKMEALETRQLASPVHKNPNLEHLYRLCDKKSQVCDSREGVPVHWTKIASWQLCNSFAEVGRPRNGCSRGVLQAFNLPTRVTPLLVYNPVNGYTTHNIGSCIVTHGSFFHAADDQ